MVQEAQDGFRIQAQSVLLHWIKQWQSENLFEDFFPLDSIQKTPSIWRSCFLISFWHSYRVPFLGKSVQGWRLRIWWEFPTIVAFSFSFMYGYLPFMISDTDFQLMAFSIYDRFFLNAVSFSRLIGLKIPKSRTEIKNSEWVIWLIIVNMEKHEIKRSPNSGPNSPLFHSSMKRSKSL